MGVRERVEIVTAHLILVRATIEDGDVPWDWLVVAELQNELAAAHELLRLILRDLCDVEPTHTGGDPSGGVGRAAMPPQPALDEPPAIERSRSHRTRTAEAS